MVDISLDDMWYNFNFCGIFAATTLLFSYRSEGGRHMPKTGPVLVIANHESFLDPVLAGLPLQRRVWFLARKTLFKPAWFAWYLRSMGTLPVDLEGVAKEGLQASVEQLKANRALLVFPEGERTRTGVMGEFKAGIALVLRKVPVPIVPVGIAGAYESFPPGKKFPRFSPLFWPWTGGSVGVSVGKAIYPEEYQKLPREGLLRMLEDRVRGLITRAEKLVRKPA